MGGKRKRGAHVLFGSLEREIFVSVIKHCGGVGCCILPKRAPRFDV